MPTSSRIRRRSYGFWRLLRANLYDLWLLLNESWVVLAGFFAVTVGATFYIRFGYDPCRYDGNPQTERCPLTLAESLYETIKLQTLQSGLAFPSESLLGQIIFFLVPLLGLALIFQGVLNFGRLLLDKGSRREAWQIALAATHQNHVIVCGLGRVGMRTVMQLIESGYEAVVIERDLASEFVQRALNHKIPVVIGDAREEVTLKRAGLMRARAVVTAVNDDLLNIEIALSIRALRPQTRLILRIFNDDLDRNLEKTFGRNAAYSASALAAPTYAAATVSPQIDVVLPTAAQPLGISRVVLRSAVTNVAELEELGVRVLQAGTATAPQLLPVPERPLRAGEQISMLGPLTAIEQVQQAHHPAELPWRGGFAANHHQLDTVIICGLGKVGYRVVKQLHAMQPRPRIVVLRLDQARADFPQRIAELEGVETVIGDARELDALLRAGLERAYSIAALTSDDLLNLQISLVAQRVRPDIKIVVRVFSDVLAERLSEIFGIRAVYSTSGLASPTLTAAALIGGVEHSFTIGNRLMIAESITISATHRLAGLTLAQLRVQHNLIVLDIRRAGHTLCLPGAMEQLLAGDQATLLGSTDAVMRVR
jgi:Trk K+ transport system NAD-binding subunit